MKQVRETAAAKMLQVYVVLMNGAVVARVHSHYSGSGVCTVDVWGEQSLIYQGKAGGFGYDKFTSALAGAEIEGVLLTDHCGGDKIPYPEGLDHYPRDSVAPKGYYFTNYVIGGAQSCYRYSGLDVLKHWGMVVEQVL